MGIDPGTAIIGSAILGLGGSLLSSESQSGAIESASQIQGQYGQASIDFQREMFNKLLELQQPYYGIGTSAISPYLQYLGLPGQPQPTIAPRQPPGITPAGMPSDIQSVLTGNLPFRGNDFDAIKQALVQSGNAIAYADDPNRFSLKVPTGWGTMPGYTEPVDWVEVTPRSINQYNIRDLIAHYAPTTPAEITPTPSSQVGVPDTTLPPGQSVIPQTIPGTPTPATTPITPTAQGFEASPLYQWQLEQGTSALENALRARGKYDSTAGLRAIGDFTRALGAEETEKYYNRLLDAINIGRGAATTSGAGAIQTGQGVGATYNQLANALAANVLSQGQVQGGFYSGLGGLPMNLASLYYGLGSSGGHFEGPMKTVNPYYYP